MNEYLLKAIIRLYAIVAKGNVTDESRERIKFIVRRQTDSESTEEYLQIFDEYAYGGPAPIHENEQKELDPNTEEFVEDWANIMLICKRINQESTQFQKILVILRIMELSQVDGQITEREDNLVYYISKAINISNELTKSIKQFVLGQEISELSNENMLIVDDGNAEDYGLCKNIERPNLTGFMAVLYIRELESYIIKYVGISHIRLNGAPLRSRFNYVFPAGSVIRGDKIRPIYYSDIVSKFKLVEVTERIQINADKISVKFKQGRIGLRDIYVNEESGKLVGIMGASGSGKSTLLETLNGKIKPMSGKVLINGINIHEDPASVQGLIGYVPQDDLLMEDLTVFDNLYYAAKLCLDHYRESQIIDVVHSTLRNLGIYEIKDLVVGNPLKKTISGGQRKRLNIALELLREPSILFIDEPTSGLSSRDSENIMDLLKELALKGKLVFATIHQPSSDIYKLFDSLLLLDVGGYQIYYGNPTEAIVYFRNVVNLIQRDQGACITCGNVKVEQIFNIIETRIVNEYGQFTSKRRISPKEWSEHFKKEYKHHSSEEEIPLPIASFKIPNRIRQFKVFYKRDLLSKLKNKQYLLLNLIEAPLLALIIGYFLRYYDKSSALSRGYVFAENPNIPNYFFMSIIVALFMGLSVSGEEIIKDRRIREREKFLHLSNGSYLFSKIVILFVLSGIQMLSYVLIGHYLLGFKEMYFATWAVLFSAACFANAVGLNISSAFNSVITIYIIVPIILIPQLMFNGVAIEFDKLNPNISDKDKVPLLGEVMASKWAYEAIMVHQFKKNKYDRKFYNYDQEMSNAQYYYAYYIPTLKLKLEECLPALRGEIAMESVSDQLSLVKNELLNELTKVDRVEILNFKKFTPAEFDSTTYIKAAEVIGILKKKYILRYNKIRREKEAFTKRYERSIPDIQKYYLELKENYRNEQVSNIVRNISSPVRVLQIGERLVRKVDPIFADPEKPANSLNFRAHYYAPRKYFAGSYFDTFWFNLTIIWVMTIMALVALYFDLLKRIFNLLDKIAEFNLNKYVAANKYIFRKRVGR